MKGLAHNSIIMFCLLLKLIFVIVFRLTDGVMHVLSSINFLLRDARFGFPATSLTAQKGPKFARIRIGTRGVYDNILRYSSTHDATYT